MLLSKDKVIPTSVSEAFSASLFCNVQEDNALLSKAFTLCVGDDDPVSSDAAFTSLFYMMRTLPSMSNINDMGF